MEVVVATVLISAMLVSMLSFVQVAADNWRRTDQTINLTAELNTIDHYFTMQSLEALDISYPAVGVTSYTVKFWRTVATGTLGTTNYYTGKLELVHTVLPGTKILTSKSGSTQALPPVVIGVADSVPTTINRYRYLASLSAHVGVASFTRLATNTVRLFVRLEAPRFADDTATPTLEATMTYFFPNVQ